MLIFLFCVCCIDLIHTTSYIQAAKSFLSSGTSTAASAAGAVAEVAASTATAVFYSITSAIMGNIYFISLEDFTSFSSTKVVSAIESAVQTVTGGDLAPLERTGSWIDHINGASIVWVRIYKRSIKQFDPARILYQKIADPSDTINVDSNQFRGMWSIKDTNYAVGFKISQLITYLVRFTFSNSKQDYDICMYWYDMSIKSDSKPNEQKQIDGLRKVLDEMFKLEPKARWVLEPYEVTLSASDFAIERKNS